MQELAEQWKKRGLIKRYMIVDDELINKGGTKKYDTKHRNFLYRRGKIH